MATTREVQDRLRELGYYNGRIDGDIGPASCAAILRALAGISPSAAPAAVQTTSAAGRAAIAKREGNKLTAYRDSVGILTIGVGHTSAGAPAVTAGMRITAEESDAILSRDLAQFEAAVRNAVKVPIEQHEMDALVSIAFNIGGSAFGKSTLVRKLNAGDRAGAANAFLSWDKAGGRTLPGLTTRRKAERLQFLGA